MNSRCATSVEKKPKKFIILRLQQQIMIRKMEDICNSVKDAVKPYRPNFGI